MYINLIITVLIIVNPLRFCLSHFRGGSITWRYKNNRQIYIKYKLSFRRDIYDHFCNKLDSNVTIRGEGYLETFVFNHLGYSDSRSLINQMSYLCTGFSEDENWTYGQNTVLVTMPFDLTSQTHILRYSGKYWIPLVSGSPEWLLQLTVNLTYRGDIGRINSSPTASFPPFLRLKYGCLYSLSIPVKDEDGDIIKCRWANTYMYTRYNITFRWNSWSECSYYSYYHHDNNLLCQPPSNLFLNKDMCVITYNSTVSTGFYVVALQIEDFAIGEAVNALSSIPLQFLIEVTFQNSSDSCEIKPVFETLHDTNSIIEIPVYTKYHQNIIARGFTISKIQVISQIQLTISELLMFGTSYERWYINVTWIPSPIYIGNHSICYTAFDIISQSSEKICTAVNVTSSINYCMENVDSFHTKWNITAANTQVNLSCTRSTHFCVEHVDRFNNKWNTTVINTNVNVSCTGEYLGYASRNCTGEGIWGEPNYSQCISTKHYCGENVDRFNIKWSLTKPKSQVNLFCTGDYVGNVSRNCNGVGIWDEPNYSQCISKSLQYLVEQTARLLSGGSEYNIVTIILEDLENITRVQTGLRSGDLLASSAILNAIAKYVTDHKEKLAVNQLEIFGSLCDNLLQEKNHQTWDELTDEGLTGVTSLVNAVTDYNNAFNQVIDGEYSVVVVKDNIVMEVGRNSSDDITVPDRLKTSESWIADSATEIKLKKNICSGLTGYSSTFYRNISRFFPKFFIDNGEVRAFDGWYDVNSIIADFTVTGKSCSDFSLVVTFGHLLGNFSRPYCGFWNFTAFNTVNGAWSSFGSQVMNSTDSYTICEYNHTTNFAVLMSPGLTPMSHHLPLSMISAIGCGISIVFLVITLIVHCVLWKYVKNDRTKILMNLCVVLILSYIIFLAGITRTDNKEVCTAIAVALHYIFLTDFALMLAEGIHLVRMVVIIFPSKSIIQWLLPACWVLPGGIVGIAASVTKLKGYGNQKICWLTLESNLIWAFIGPALLVILINFVIIIITVSKIMTSKGLAKKTIQEKSKIGSTSICVMLPLFGVTWVLGAFSLNEDLVMFQYLFSTFNSLQGLFICLFHCFLNKKVREGYHHFQRRRKANRMDTKLSSDLTNYDNNKKITAHQRKYLDTEERNKGI
ncbi:adhesion G protein-coupled receptor L3-like [Mytilus trossulus]|uniref:adhesion G protein-coupled receptor L3-like n=1 Tax=Mytilus trossulus TaxID=6551 RepID=UPI00300579A0